MDTQKALDKYNRCYNNQTYMAARRAIDENIPIELKGNSDQWTVEVANRLTDACLLVCGMKEYQGALHDLRMMALLMPRYVTDAIMLHINNFRGGTNG